MCSALNFSAQRRKLDASLQTGFRWLLRIIGRMWIELDGRVTADVERKSEHEKREKTERAKRVQRSRELRFTHVHNCFTALFRDYPVSRCQKKKLLLDFVVQGEILEAV